MVGEAARIRKHVDEVFSYALLQHADLELRWLRSVADARGPQVCCVHTALYPCSAKA